jgi:hypothetical protein
MDKRSRRSETQVLRCIRGRDNELLENASSKLKGNGKRYGLKRYGGNWTSRLCGPDRGLFDQARVYCVPHFSRAFCARNGDYVSDAMLRGSTEPFVPIFSKMVASVHRQRLENTR